MNAIGRMFINTHVNLFRLTGGKFFGSMGKGRRALLLTTTGKKTGLSRTVPVVYIEDNEGNPVVTASMGGAPANPAWFENLKANPEVTYEIGAEKVRARAVIAEPALRDQLWAKLTSKHQNFAEYAKKTTRIIPMVVLKAVH